jgi:hypothetical protein
MKKNSGQPSDTFGHFLYTSDTFLHLRTPPYTFGHVAFGHLRTPTDSYGLTSDIFYRILAKFVRRHLGVRRWRMNEKKNSGQPSDTSDTSYTLRTPSYTFGHLSEPSDTFLHLRTCLRTCLRTHFGHIFAKFSRNYYVRSVSEVSMKIMQ